MNTSKRIMIIIGLVIVALVVVFSVYDGWYSKTHAAVVGFDPLDGQIALMDRVYQTWFGERIDVMQDTHGKHVVCSWLMYKAYAESKSDQASEALKLFHENSMEFAVAFQVRSDYWASVVSWELFKQAAFDENARQELYNTCQPITPDLPKYFMNEVEAFKTLAKAEGLLDAQGHLEASKDRLAFILYRHIWIKASELLFPRRAIEPPEEAMTMFRWQIEVSHLPLEDKLAQLHKIQAKQPLAYDYDYAEAYLKFLDGDAAGACQKLKSMLQSDGIVDIYKQNQYHATLKKIQQAHPTACTL